MINKENYKKIKEQAEAKNATLVAVSKFKPNTDILQLYDLGQRDFGENYVQELAEKQEDLPKDIHWHFIGHLQRNKVKYIAPFVHLIHSVDSFKLLEEINKEAKKNNRVISCLLEMHVTREENKTGMTDKELLDFMNLYNAKENELQHVKIVGIMGMATFTEDQALIRKDLKTLKTIFDFTYDSYFSYRTGFKLLSMGMSADYEMALEEGSNMIRVGSLIFGARDQA